MALGNYSTGNVVNSITTPFSQLLLEAGYVVYWYETDVLQTLSGLKPTYSLSQQTYLADSGFQAELAAAVGLFTLRPEMSAIPRAIDRPTVDGTIAGLQGEVAIPAASLTVGSMVAEHFQEVGTRQMYRVRSLEIEAYLRTAGEAQQLADSLSETFDTDTSFAIYNHDGLAPTTPVGSLLVKRPLARRTTLPGAQEATTYQVTFSAMLEYVA